MPRAKPTPAAPPPFTGFAQDAPRFFHELAATMSRAWWQEHKGEYEALWVAPMTALLTRVRAELAPAYRGVALAEPKLFRIHRDVRFGKDKTPYKTHCAGVVSTTAGPTMEAGAAVYVQLGLEEFAGAGFYVFTPEQLARWRKAVLDPRRGAEAPGRGRRPPARGRRPPPGPARPPGAPPGAGRAGGPPRGGGGGRARAGARRRPPGGGGAASTPRPRPG
ncbi:MAG: DUF2461 family protein [Myxococcales bacterium]|nr:DUF2461 family protein [Myxococcales bacterium]